MRYRDIDQRNDRFVSVRPIHSNGYDVDIAFDVRLLNKVKVNCDTGKNSNQTNTSRMADSEIGEDISFLVPFLNFFHYLLLVPFRAVLDTNSNQYRIQTHLLHKIVCPFVHAIGVFEIVVLWLLSFFQVDSNVEPSIVVLFDFVNYLANAFATFLSIFIMWWRRDMYLEVIECTRVKLKRGKAIKILIFLGLVISSGAWCVINWFFLHDQQHHGSLHNLLAKYIPGMSLSDDDVLYVVLTGLLVHASLFYIVGQGPILILVLALGQLGKKFGTELESVSNIQKGTELYRKLKGKADCITKLFGNILTSYYIISICYYAEAPHVLLGKRGDTERAMMAYYAFTSVIWIFAAEFHKHIEETVLKWISFHTENPDLSNNERLKLVAISNEMSIDPVALSSRYFCVTYQQFSSMLGLVVTYGMIVFQQQNGSTCNEIL